MQNALLIPASMLQEFDDPAHDMALADEILFLFEKAKEPDRLAMAFTMYLMLVGVGKFNFSKNPTDRAGCEGVEMVEQMIKAGVHDHFRSIADSVGPDVRTDLYKAFLISIYIVCQQIISEINRVQDQDAEDIIDRMVDTIEDAIKARAVRN